MTSWTSTAGPIQTRRVIAVLNALRRESQTFTEHGYALYSPFGGAVNAVAVAELGAINARYEARIDSTNHKAIIADATAAIERAVAARPERFPQVAP